MSLGKKNPKRSLRNQCQFQIPHCKVLLLLKLAIRKPLPGRGLWTSSYYRTWCWVLSGKWPHYSLGPVGVKEKMHVRKVTGWKQGHVLNTRGSLVAQACFWLKSESFRWMECKPHTNYWNPIKETPFSVCLSIHPPSHTNTVSQIYPSVEKMEKFSAGFHFPYLPGAGWQLKRWNGSEAT